MKSMKVYTVKLFFLGAKTKYNKIVFPTQTVGLTCVSRNINQISLGSVVPLPPNAAVANMSSTISIRLKVSTIRLKMYVCVSSNPGHCSAPPVCRLSSAALPEAAARQRRWL